MDFPDLCQKLFTANQKNDEKKKTALIGMISELIIDDFDFSLLSLPDFLQLPLDQILKIIESSSFEVTLDNVEFIQNFIQKLIEKNPNNNSISFLLNSLIISDELIHNFPKFMSLISCFNNIKVLKQLSKSFNLTQQEFVFVPVIDKPIDYEPDIFTAILKRKMESVQYSVEVDKIDPAAIWDKRFRMSPLHFACKTGDIYMAQYFIKRAPNLINSVDKYGATPLHIAARSGHIDLVKYLIENAGADYKMRDLEEHSPLHMAAEKGNVGVLNYLLSTKLFDIEEKDKHGYTPLHYSCYCGRLQATRFLVEYGKAQINAVNINRYTPLHLASAMGHSQIIIYLLSRGADKTIRNVNTLLPSGVACEYCKDNSKANSIAKLFN